GYGLGQVFPLLNQETREKIWIKILEIFKKNIQIGFGFGEGIAQVFPLLNQKTRDKIWIKILEIGIENSDFAVSFGEGIAQVFESISETDFENILKLAIKSYEFAIP
ncbi:MAG: hypothetical protein WCF03_07760, partial [Nitrososphaeraceae archaeon]